jgi:ankyrin repeat protein
MVTLHCILIRFLLQHDQGAVSQPTIHGILPLRIACFHQSLEIAKLVFNAYPQAIHTRNNEGETPLDGWRNVDARTFLEAQLQWERQAREQRQPDEQGRLPIHRFLQTPEVSVGTVELMISANPESATALDNAGLNPLHYACNFGQVDVVKLLVDSNENSLKQLGLSGELPLHLACREGKCGVINCILGRSDYGVSSRNKDGHLPIELLLFCEHDVDRDSLEYVEAMHRLLRGYPCVMENLNGGNSHDDDKSREASSRFVKRKHANI